MSSLYCSVTNTSGIRSVTITGNHDSPIAQANIEARTTSLSIGSTVTIDMGYTTNHRQLFLGYVKQIEKKLPDNTYVITAYDLLVRAQDYYIASSNPDTPLSYQNITAETLVGNLLSLAGLNNLTTGGASTGFVFGITKPFEINLVSVFDYIRSICELLTWSLWVDAEGTVHFENRKPYVMLNDTGQPGDHADSPIAGVNLNEMASLDITHTISERSLRNRVVVYGTQGIHAESSATSPYLPANFYKTAVLAFPQLVDDTSLASDIADYNLNLLNRLTETISINTVGDPRLEPRKVVEITNGTLSLNGNWYIYGCDQTFSQTGYITSLDLRRMTA